jgi:hypothetical protein
MILAMATQSAGNDLPEKKAGPLRKAAFNVPSSNTAT